MADGLGLVGLMSDDLWAEFGQTPATPREMLTTLGKA